LSGIGPSELILLVVVGLLILGPERLPRVATQIGRWVGRARRTANQLRYQLEREITLADIEGKKKKKEEEARQKDKGGDKDGEDASTAPSETPDAAADRPAEGSDSTEKAESDARND
jgi:sec-independent protein translocase protein TatB